MGGDSYALKVCFTVLRDGAPVKSACVSPVREAMSKFGRTLPVLRVAWASPASLTAPQQPMAGAFMPGPQSEQAWATSLASSRSQQGLWQGAPATAADAARFNATAKVRIIWNKRFIIPDLYSRDLRLSRKISWLQLFLSTRLGQAWGSCGRQPCLIDLHNCGKYY